MLHPITRRPAGTATTTQATPEFKTLVDAVQRLQAAANETSASKGRKAGRVALRLTGATVKAVTVGANAGAAYVTDHQGLYAGKITPDGRFWPVKVDRDTGMLVAWEIATESLRAATADPTAAAIRYGRETGKCSCCGRKLDRKDSIELGIGPICLDKLGGAWG